MAAWGPKLYQDDIAEDVRSYYKDELKRGKSNEEVTEELISDNEDVILDEDDASVFWFALADTQWGLGRLLPIVKEKALEYLKLGLDLKRWNEEGSKREAEIRKKVLQDLEEKLNSDMPAEKKISQYKLYKCEWKIGDSFAYKLESNEAMKAGVFGKYLIIRKVDECIWWPGHVIPIVYIQITENDKLIYDKIDMEKLEYIKIFEDKGKEYRTKLISTSKRIIPSGKLKYIGNYVNLETPKDEYIPKDKINISSNNWSNFEETIIDSYIRLNLK